MARKDKKVSRAAEKKKERLELEQRMNSRLAIVKAANQVENPLQNLPTFQNFSKNDLTSSLKTVRANDLDEATKTWLMDLMRTNMKESYEQSSWGWKEANKREEMFEDAAWYLIARDMDMDENVAFAHFRFDMDYDDEVLYVYEIQLDDRVRRKGLGRFMMQTLEFLSFKADMRKIMLTSFKHNPEANQFFKKALKYDIDETCPIDDVYEQFDYEILSKFNNVKLRREEKEENENENNGSKANE